MCVRMKPKRCFYCEVNSGSWSVGKQISRGTELVPKAYGEVNLRQIGQTIFGMTVHLSWPT
jgi:hypothetical protein